MEHTQVSVFTNSSRSFCVKIFATAELCCSRFMRNLQDFLIMCSGTVLFRKQGNCMPNLGTEAKTRNTHRSRGFCGLLRFSFLSLP